MRHTRSLRLFVLGLIATLNFLSLLPASASSANISHSYHTTDSVSNGDIVSLDPSLSNFVDLANVNNGSRLLGVALPSNQLLLAVNPSNTMVQIATTGSVSTLVSTLNGDIAVGDKVAVSPFDGIGIKALPGSYYIGLAETAFDSHSQGAIQQQVTDKQGHTTNLTVGYVQLNIAIGINNTVGGPNLNALQKIAQSLSGHTISTIRIVIAIIVATVALTAFITLIYASIYGTVISVGRNPLAKNAVFRTMGFVLGMAVLMAGVSGITIFLLLR